MLSDEFFYQTGCRSRLLQKGHSERRSGTSKFQTRSPSYFRGNDMIHFSINAAPCSSTLFVLVGGICLSPLRVIRLKSTDRSGAPGAIKRASAMPRVSCSGASSMTLAFASGVFDPSSIRELPPPSATWQIAQFTSK